MLLCTDCKETKDKSEFHRASGTKRGYQYRCRVCQRVYAKNYYARNRKQIRRRKQKEYHERVAKYGRWAVNKRKRDRSQAIRAEVRELLGGVCVRCGFDGPRALQVDHVNGDGSAERRVRRTEAIYLKILNEGKEGYQLLCANCNWIKARENQEVRGEQIRI